MRVLITGAAGLIGGIVRAELAKDHELILVDRVRIDAPNAWRRDLRWYFDDRKRVKKLLFWPSWWERAFTGVDVVVHLAANGNPFAPWRRVGRDNIATTRHVLDAAARFGVPRVVFASSTWAVKGTERALAPDCYGPDGPKIGSDALLSPIGWYGLAKAMGELAGRAMVAEGRLRSFIAVRIGWCAPQGRLPGQDHDESLWIGHRDTARLLRRCVEADVAGCHVFYGMSSQAVAPFSLAYTTATIGWRPEETPPVFGERRVVRP